MRNKNLNVNSVFFALAILIFLSLFTIVFEAKAEENDPAIAAQNVGDKVSNMNSTETLNQFLQIFSGSGIEKANVSPFPTRTSQSSVPSVIYEPIPANSSVTETVDVITNIIHEHCVKFGKGVVKSQNSFCVEPIAKIIRGSNGANVVTDLKTSANLYKTLQCVGCATAFSNLIIPFHVTGHAKDYLGKKIPGYRYIPNPKNATTFPDYSQIKPGSLFIINKYTFGHIGVVAEVKDSRSFRAFECNFRAPGMASNDLIWSFNNVDGFQVPI